MLASVRCGQKVGFEKARPWGVDVVRGEFFGGCERLAGVAFQST